MNEIPAEVLKHASWKFGPVEGVASTAVFHPERLVFFRKSEFSRGDAWHHVRRLSASVPSETDNPWRKCHTESYWAWYRKDET